MLRCLCRRLLVLGLLLQIPQLCKVIFHLAHGFQYVATVLCRGLLELGLGLAFVGAQAPAVEDRQVHQRPQRPVPVAGRQQVTDALGLPAQHTGQTEIREPRRLGHADRCVGRKHATFSGGNVRATLQQVAGQLRWNAGQRH